MTPSADRPILEMLNEAFGFNFEPTYHMPENERTAIAQYVMARGRSDIANRLIREEINEPQEAA